jgi:hypothetical protein
MFRRNLFLASSGQKSKKNTERGGTIIDGGYGRRL